MSSTGEFASDGTTLVAVVAGYEADGYVAQVVAEEGARLRCLACREASPASDYAVDSLRRTEGASDPADMAVVAAVACPRCGARGTAVLKYGPEAGAEDAEVLAVLDTAARLADDRPTGGTGAGEPA